MTKKNHTKATTMAAGLVLLLLNDVWWKWAYPGWVTGKLSDFVGLYVFPLFVCHFVPRYRPWAYWGIAILFAWWKSPLASDTIYCLNTHHLPFSRVADVTDYWAYTALLASYLLHNNQSTDIPMLQNRLGAIAVLCLFCADSIPMHIRTTPVATHPCSIKLTVPQTEESLLKKLKATGSMIHIDAVRWGWYYYDTSVYNEHNVAQQHDTVSHFYRIGHLSLGTDTFANINLHMTPYDSFTTLQITGFDMDTDDDTRKRRREEKRLANVLKMWLKGIASP